MKELKNKLKLFFAAFSGIFSQEISPLSVCLSFLGIIVLRIFEEKFLAFSTSPWEDVGMEFMHNLFFFAITFLLIWLVLGWFLQKKPIETLPLILWASFLILLPPLSDMAKTGGNVFWSFYLLNDIRSLGLQFITLFGHLPSGIVYFGTKITFILAVILVVSVVYLKTKNIWKTLASSLVTYIALFFMGSFPSWFVFLAYFLQKKSVTEVTAVKVAQFFGSPAPVFGLENATLKYALAYQLGFVFYLLLIFLLGVVFFLNNRIKFWAVVKNARFPQLTYHIGLLGVGLVLGWWVYPQHWHVNLFSFLAIGIIAVSTILAWLASVVVNDIYDYQVDLVSNSYRPLQQKIFTLVEYKQLGWVLFIFSLIGGATINMTYVAVLLVYQILAWFYSAPPYRLKKIPLVATFFSALASMLILFLGFILFSGTDKLGLFPWRIGWMLLVGLTLSLPIKDFRDVEGDKKDGVLTIPVLLGHDLGRLVVGAGIFISFVLSVFFLHEFRLFWWAVLCGGSAFWLMNSPDWRRKIQDKDLVWWILAVVAVYVVILGKILFFS
jgi:4-hydroxybenzoate polyprenyltransferase